MADVKISQLPAATLPLTGVELVPVVQSGVTKQVVAAGIGTGVVNVKAYGAIGDGVANDTAAIQAAIAAAPVNGAVFFPAGVFCGYVFVWRSDISLIGAGSAATTIKLPNNCASVTVPWEPGGTITGLPNVIEIGQCALGNAAAAYSNVTVRGMTLDGNYTNNIAPVTDLFGHGLIATKVSNLVLADVVGKNCYATGIDIVINSNYAKVSARVENCGNALILGGRYPNFDINSSKYGIFDIISSGGYYGGRMLDNCWGNQLNITVYNPSITGLVYNNQSVNVSYSNTINVSVIDGCSGGQGVSVGNLCYSSTVNATIRNVAGTGFYAAGSSEANAPRSNKFNVNTFGCGGSAVYDAGLFNQYEICSRYDGDTGPAGSFFAVDINGKNNQFVINIEDQPTPQVRGVVIRSGATSNAIVDYKFNTNVQTFLNQETGNTTKYFNPQIPYSPVIGTWQSVSLNGGWSNTFGAPYPVVGYTIDAAGRVSVRGTVTGGSGTIFTLPAGFRPTNSMLFPTWANSALGRLEVDSAGAVTLASGTATSVDLSPITFTVY
jgi:hypothetical protein